VGRRLAAILAADVVGYSRLIGKDDAGTVALLKAHRANLFDPTVLRHGGRIVKLMGDGTLVEFASALSAVECAIEIQQLLAGEEGTLKLRIGVGLGDIISDDDNDVYGDGVNIAARLEALAQPGGICISDMVYQNVFPKLGKTFEGIGEQSLKNIERPVIVWKWPAAHTSDHTGTAVRRLEIPAKPSIAVLPFANMSGDSDQDYFSDGITEDLTTELSRYDELFVIARNSTVEFKARSADVRSIGQELGVGHVLAGSVRRAGNRIRISAQLIDAQSGHHIWADRFDREMEDIFAVQDDITAVIVNSLLGKLAHKEYERSLHKRPEALGAYDHALRASVLLTDWDREDTRLARTAAKRAVEWDPGFARAHALLAWAYSLEGILRWSQDPEESFRKSFQAAIKAVELDYEEPWAHAALGVSELWGRREHDHGNASLRRAIELNPNNAHFRLWHSNGLCLAGRSEEGLTEIETAMRLNPNYPPIYLHFHARILATLQRYSEALRLLERLVRLMPTSTNSLALYAACNVALGRREDAEKAVAQILQISPTFSLGTVPKASPYAKEEDLQTYLDLLRQAGLPD
jgi:adenylate cyclase